MKLILCGDICPTELTRPAFDAGDVAALLGGAEDIIKSGDFALANLECALTDGEKAIRKLGALLKGRPQDAAVLAGCGFTHMGLSNNHTLDYGVAGMRDTVRSVLEAGMIPFGFGENDQDSRKTLFLEKDGLRVGIVAVCEHEYTYALRDQFGANPFDPFDTMEDIALAKAQADRVIVMYMGRVVEFGSVEQVFTNPVHPYTKALMKSVPVLGMDKDRDLTVIEGTTPDASTVFTGCEFAERCEFAKPECSHRFPKDTEVEDGHRVRCLLYEKGGISNG